MIFLLEERKVGGVILPGIPSEKILSMFVESSFLQQENLSVQGF